MFRRDKKSKYTRENVSIASGGRLALTRLASALGNVNMGHFIPDYTAYEELLSVFKAFSPIPILNSCLRARAVASRKYEPSYICYVYAGSGQLPAKLGRRFPANAETAS